MQKAIKELEIGELKTE